MYTSETRNKFSMKDVFLQFLFVALFIFILIWLFPLKSDFNKLRNDVDSTQSEFSIIFDRIFNENVIAMKDGAKGYFTTSRLPKNTGDTVKLTLKEMLNLKIVLPFTDKNGDTCSEEESYVEITKYDDEFVMKVNLKCGKQENYLLVYMGCYDYCSTSICEKNKTDIKTPTIYTPDTPNKQPEETPVIPPVEYVTYYQYSKSVTNYSEWSEWSNDVYTASSTREVKTQTIKKTKLVGYNVISTDNYDEPIWGTVTAVVGSISKNYCASYDYVTTGEIKYTDWTYVGEISTTVAPISTETTKYEKVGDYNWYCEEDCSSGTVMLYKMYTRTPANVVTYQCTNTKTVKTAVTAEKTIITGYAKIETKEPVYKVSYIDQYSYRDLITSIDYKWSTYADLSLLNAGYVYTGNTNTVAK